MGLAPFGSFWVFKLLILFIYNAKMKKKKEEEDSMPSVLHYSLGLVVEHTAIQW